ncbi:hypothetical protein GWN63_05060 [Candidatus Bathyarchaeota archaeon]|nr:dual specificity protein phosphatase family protein [Candidatus Bathyarchaeota archaeon]NIU81595.1 hypothetical protein [Candidatus Bathyarchaeota archaeon]NIV68240.1 hypothetical protein [Candidatus Bathyarchaeota archaeon]NIW15988.1 hypothetical protein [Candidatus Bathyarchaeota archaeon]NIW34765.1 hypothetical protein [Candidatus Bathyarchaeota archaeon]
MISRILDRLYVGDRRFTSEDLAKLDISYVLTVGDNPRPNHYWCPLVDGRGNDWDDVLKAVNIVQYQLTSGDIMLIHCDEGMSRSPFIVALYLNKIGMSFKEATEFVRRRHPPTAINPHLLDLARRNNLF